MVAEKIIRAAYVAGLGSWGVRTFGSRWEAEVDVVWLRAVVDLCVCVVGGNVVRERGQGNGKRSDTHTHTKSLQGETARQLFFRFQIEKLKMFCNS